ncbi:MAG: hypothetical protein ABH877_04275 [bacterium]
MGECYAILFIEVATRKVVGALLASAYPVAQTAPGLVVQVKIWKASGRDYGEAYGRMKAALRGPDRRWFAEIARATGHGCD